MNYYFEISKPKEPNAGSKAPDDICKIANMKGWHAFIMPSFPKNKGFLYKKFWLCTVALSKWIELCFKLKDGDNVLFQYPMYGYILTKKFIPFIRKFKNVRFITVIHDIESIRGGIGNMFEKRNLSTEKDISLLMKFDRVISHNIKMTKYLTDNGISNDKIINLDVFDYICDFENYDVNKRKDNSIVIAGILSPEKTGYIYKLLDKNLDLDINLFGPGFIQKNKNVNYYGAFSPEELLHKLKGSFGLIWDGPEIYSCTGNTGKYLKFNNPHKTSLFCAANLPIIVWEDAAIADFIKNNKIGITVQSLDELDSVISSISEEEYKEMYNNMHDISIKVKNGYFFDKALDKAIKS